MILQVGEIGVSPSFPFLPSPLRGTTETVDWHGGFRDGEWECIFRRYPSLPLRVCTKGGVIPAPVPVPVSVFQPMFTPDTGTGTFAPESLVPAPSLSLAPSV